MVANSYADLFGGGADTGTGVAGGAPEGYAVRIPPAANVFGDDGAAAARDATYTNVWDAEYSIATQSRKHAGADTAGGDGMPPGYGTSVLIANNPAFKDGMPDHPGNGPHVTPRARPADAKADAFDGFYEDSPTVAEHDRAVREMRGNAVGDTKPGAGGTPDSSGVQTLHIPGLGNVDVFADTEPNTRDTLAETTFAAGGANTMSC